MGDLNNDGFPDVRKIRISESHANSEHALMQSAVVLLFVQIAVANGVGALVMLNNGSGYFPASLQRNLTQQFGQGVSIGDVNNDHNADIVIGLSSGAAAVFLGSGTGSFTLKGLYNVGATKPVIANLFKLSTPQIFAWDSSDFTTTLGNGDGTFKTGSQWLESSHFPFVGKI